MREVESIFVKVILVEFFYKGGLRFIEGGGWNDICIVCE